MYTRGNVEHTYGPNQSQLQVRDGAARISRMGDIPVMWPVARPVTSWTADSAYYQGTMHRTGNLVRGGTQALIPTAPNVEMDPSNRATWQREYRFSNGR